MMCGRYSLLTPLEELRALFELTAWPDADPLGWGAARYNIAPTQQVAVVHGPGRQLRYLRWGLVPSWQEQPAAGPLRINARAETVATKVSFRDAVRARRCLIPFDGFYEWKNKQPFLLTPMDRNSALAGIWEPWRRGEDVLDSCAIITVPATGEVAQLHGRMPLLVAKESWAEWLDPSRPAGLTPRPMSWTLRPVSRLLGNAANEGPQLLKPPDEQLPLLA